MADSTARLALPFPDANDTADIPRDIEALAERIEALTGWIRTADVIDGAVTTAKLGDEQVTLAKLAQAVRDPLVPTGSILATARSTAPAGYLLCDGAAVSRTTHAGLFAAIGSAYGAGDGSTTFNLPNLKGKVPVGRDAAQTEFDALGESGGSKTHTLTEAQLPAHDHTTAYARTSNAAGTPNGLQAVTSAVAANINTDNAGGGGAHNNLQPYQVVNYMIKT